jgi:5-methylcytosine-specific restriction endonuclease McrA
MALDFNEEGHFVSVPWNKWLDLVMCDRDDCIHTPTRSVRAPRVLVAHKLNRVVTRRPRLSLKNLRERDSDRCAYTLRQLKPHECSMEHVLPRSSGGKTCWDNVVLADKAINHKRGNKDLDEVGATAFPEWRFFLTAKAAA